MMVTAMAVAAAAVTATTMECEETADADSGVDGGVVGNILLMCRSFWPNDTTVICFVVQALCRSSKSCVLANTVNYSFASIDHYTKL